MVSFILDAMYRFSKFSGHFLNPSKCSVFFSNVPIATLQSILHRTGFSWGNLPLKFLGLSLVDGRVRERDCQSLMHSLLAEPLSRKSFVNCPGRYQLVQSVLFQVQIYWSSVLSMFSSQ